MYDLDYPTSITRLSAACLHPATRQLPLRALMRALGCRTIDFGAGWRVTVPEQPAAQHESLIVSTLQEALREHAEYGVRNDVAAFSILDGLSAGARWVHCVSTICGAHNLAVLLLSASATMERAYNHETEFLTVWRPAAGPLIHEVALKWCGYHPSSPGVHSTEDLARVLFGDAWCALSATDDAHDIPYQVYVQAPPFLPGLTPEQDNLEYMALPTIGVETVSPYLE